ncbi:NAD(P)/FAD-dependent oxidoreductase [Henriciella litoralis]|uniref:NAD(P)/FAD-dependent oxidoreductase n=1 Tax=Henriciella litoralis TaxID=568102 RepID=UPI000A056820|nr:FAD-dependent oxidoreductase [Henriciella litoralis]
MTKRIGIIGSGISGLGAAFALDGHADITVFEARERAGGHAHTVDVDYDGTQLSVDMGFIVYNGLNYPNLTGFFEALNVSTEETDMSFAVSNPDGFEWASTVRGMFARKRNLFRMRFHSFWREILKFNDVARAELAAGNVGSESLGIWLKQKRFSDDFKQNYILPMGGAIWSTPPQEILDYPAMSFFRFFENHRLMHAERPVWRTVTRGSRSYVDKVKAQLGDRLKLGMAARSVVSYGNKVKVDFEDGSTEFFDDVILATHTDTSRALLAGDAFSEHRFLLNSIRYRPNRIFLHRDPAYMPSRKQAWASWNVIEAQSTGSDICLTYWMNRLQNLPKSHPLFVTLNPATPPAEEDIFQMVTFDHPQFDGAAEAAVRSLERIQGESGVWLAGAWAGSGFHEDGLKSGLRAGLSLGGRVPWSAEGVELVEVARDRADVDRPRLKVVQ